MKDKNNQCYKPVLENENNQCYKPRYKNNNLKNNTCDRNENSVSTILDSRLILATKLKRFSCKLVVCGDFAQAYFYSVERKVKIDDTLDLISTRSLDAKEEKKEHGYKPKVFDEVKERNIIRSKLECQRLAKANWNEWETFITLTFGANETDVDIANKRLKYFVDKVRRIRKDFKYIGIPEFQKRGAAHYHLLTNIDINDNRLIFKQLDNPKFKHIKYWNEGFNKVDIIKGNTKKIIGYIAKYMTKDIDERLFNRHRYFFSRNLNRPIINFINFNDNDDLDIYNKIIQDRQLVYQNEYINPYDSSKVTFLELLKK